jgi:hypothetical protein
MAPSAFQFILTPNSEAGVFSMQKVAALLSPVAQRDPFDRKVAEVGRK